MFQPKVPIVFKLVNAENTTITIAAENNHVCGLVTSFKLDP